MLAPRLLPVLALAGALGCVAPARAPEAAFAFALTSPEERALQTRVFPIEEPAAVLSACIAVLQKHGFAAEDQDHDLGVIVAFKDSESAGHRTRLRASLAAQAAGEFGLETQLRVTFQRLAWNRRGRETAREAIRAASEYEGFFEEVAESLGLPEAGAR